VNAFTWAAFGLIVAFAPLLGFVLVAREIDAVVALELCGTLTTLILLCLAEGFHRSAYMDLPVVAAAMTWIGGLVYARFFGRHL
jgi:multicomponent Na+:H+ antiporter subunit F